ncbi:MAG: cation transporter [Gammaproteobacteria bacterium]|nr:cation transporter [Gammaproteobacteria bacterium]
MKYLWMILTLAVLLFSAETAMAANERTVAFAIEKMTCATCPITVRAAMKRVDGVKAVDVDLDSKIATVTFDASVTSVSEIAGASSNVGFPATVAEDDSQ